MNIMNWKRRIVMHTHRTLRILRGSVALSAVFLLCLSARAGVATQAQVAQALGAGEMVENFTEFHAAEFTSYAIDYQTLNSQTIDQHQGPGLVQRDLSFSIEPYPTCDLNWWGPESNGNSAEELGFNMFSTTSATASISFAQPTPAPAFGFDLIGFSSQNTQPHVTYAINLYGPGNTLIDFQRATTNGTTPVFFGYIAPSGITRVDVLDNSYAQAVGINNVVYSVPEPAACAIAAAAAIFGLGRRRRHVKMILV
ncbi:MAG: hypothetical protein ABSH08_11620 [Tepidisphaeraceae bacterium]